MQLKFNIYLLFILLFVISSCKEKAGRELQITETLPSSFLSFYEKFHQDSLFQMEHVVFPLEGIPSEPDSNMNLLDFQWSREEWIMHTPFDDMGGTFRRNFVNIDNMILEKIYNSTGNFEMERRFAELQGEWHLIYYAAMRQVR